MRTYYLPRNTKGEGRILFIFTTKSLLFTAGAAGIGSIFYFILCMFELQLIGLIVVALFALIGFGIGTIKMPEISFLEFTKKTGGENVSDIILRAIKFKRKANKVYIYKGENTNDR